MHYLAILIQNHQVSQKFIFEFPFIAGFWWIAKLFRFRWNIHQGMPDLWSKRNKVQFIYVNWNKVFTFIFNPEKNWRNLRNRVEEYVNDKRRNCDREDRLIICRNNQESLYYFNFRRLLSYEYMEDWLGTYKISILFKKMFLNGEGIF